MEEIIGTCILFVKSKAKVARERPNLHGRIISNWIRDKQGIRCGLDTVDKDQGPVTFTSLFKLKVFQ
jgi:hypothetical protein